MNSKLRIWFRDKGIVDSGSFRKYPVADLETAKTILFITVSEIERLEEIYPNMFGLEVWDEAEQDWLEWESEAGMDIREYMYEGETE